MKLKYEAPQGARMHKGFAGVYAEGELLYDTIRETWHTATYHAQHKILDRDSWISDMHSSQYDFENDCKPYGHILPKTAPKSIRAFRRYLKKHSEYLPTGTKLILHSWNTGRDVIGTIRNMDVGLEQLKMKRLHEAFIWIKNGNKEANWHWNDCSKQTACLEKSYDIFMKKIPAKQYTEKELVYFCWCQIFDIWQGHANDNMQSRQNHCAALYAYIKGKVEINSVQKL